MILLLILPSFPIMVRPMLVKMRLEEVKPRVGRPIFIVMLVAYVIKRNKRTTLALTYVRAQDTLIEVLERLFSYLAKIPIAFHRLYS